MCIDVEGRHKIVFVYRQHDYVENPKSINKSLLELMIKLLQVCMIQGKYAKASCFPVYQQQHIKFVIKNIIRFTLAPPKMK